VRTLSLARRRVQTLSVYPAGGSPARRA
jgi:hypothetical protein